MTIRYLTAAETSLDLPLWRRGIHFGLIRQTEQPEMPAPEEIKQRWEKHEPIMLPGFLTDALPRHASHISEAHQLYEATLDGTELSELLEAEPYAERLQADFSLSGTSFEDHDDQGIEKVYFDAWREDDIVADNLWCKASWLSFDDEDGSLRFRFSFGMEGYEDVASDQDRQLWAAKLTDAIFPESAAVTEHDRLQTLLNQMLGSEHVAFMERIVYFNAPNGGAQMHHDVERGHDGVVFAQMSGSTFWFALSKPRLMDEMETFLAAAPDSEWPALRQLSRDRQALACYLDDPDHELAEALIDRSAEFFQHLIEHGHGYVLHPGDVLLIRQHDLATCVWHSVVCLGDEAGEGLSFALKVTD